VSPSSEPIAVNITSECDIVAEVLVGVAPPAACGVGLYLGQVHWCGPWMWLETNPAFKEVAKLAVAKGCELLVQHGPRSTDAKRGSYRLALKRGRGRGSETKRTFQALDTTQGLSWLHWHLTSR
jgi:hypothetical protein